MAEDLTDYLSGLGLKVRYIHSEVETIERVRILTQLRTGDFDVLVASTCSARASTSPRFR
jgi:excinuclease ABC subunit B